MVICPICGKEVSVEEYSSHYDKHGGPYRVDYREDRGAKFLEEIIGKMPRYVERQDFSSILKGGMEALVEVGRLYGQVGYRGLGPMYNSISIAVLSAREGKWGAALNNINKASQDLRDFVRLELKR